MSNKPTGPSQGKSPCFREVEWTPEPYVDSGLLDGQGYNPIFIFPISIAASTSQEIQWFCEVPCQVNVSVQGPGVAWFYFRRTGVVVGTDQPHQEITKASGIVQYIFPPGRHFLTVWATSDAALTCSIVIIERELRRNQLR